MYDAAYIYIYLPLYIYGIVGVFLFSSHLLFQYAVLFVMLELSHLHILVEVVK